MSTTIRPVGSSAATTDTRCRVAQLVDRDIVGRALVDSVRKLNPRQQARNPVMFVVLVGSVLTTILFLRDLGDSSSADNVFSALIAAFLWFTVLFANFAEAMAEGRGKAQAATLRQTRQDTMARRRDADGTVEAISSSALRVGDECVVTAGEVIPSDGDVVEGIATVDESAITGESAPVIRESGGDRSAVTGGTRVLSDEIVVRITARPGETFLDRMIALVEGAERQKTPNEIALNILLSGLTIVFLLAVVTLQPFAIYAGDEQVHRRSRRPPRVPDPDDDRRAAVSHRHRRYGSPRAAQRAGHVRVAPSRRRVTSTRCCSTRRARSPSATARPPSSSRSPACASRSSSPPRTGRAWPTRRPRGVPSWPWPSRSTARCGCRCPPSRWCPLPPRPA